MAGLIKADFYRIFKDKLFLILLIIAGAMALVYPLIYFGTFYFLAEASNTDVREQSSSIGLALTMFAPFSNFGLLLSIFMIIILYKDFSNGTIRNKIIMGKSREQVFFADLFVSIIFVVGVVFAYVLLTFCFSCIFFKTGFTVENVGDYFVRLLLELFGWVVLASMMNFFVNAMKNVGLGIMLFIMVGLVFTFGGSIISATATSLEMVDRTNYESTVYVLKLLTDLNFIYSMTSTVPGESGIFAILGVSGETKLEAVFYLRYFISIVVFASASVGFGYLIFRNRDLK